MKTNNLVYNWGGFQFKKKKVAVFDTTLRDGLQSPHAQTQPTFEQKVRFLDSCVELGIDAIEIGFPVASKNHKTEVVGLAKHAVNKGYPILLSCLSRTSDKDVQSVIDVSQSSGAKVTANILIGSSKIRRLVEDWDEKTILKWIEGSIKLARKYDVDVEFVTEDGTRSDPKTLKRLYGFAIAHGVKRVWIADTVGVSTPNSTKRIVNYFVKNIFGTKKIGLDWHGHDDKGLGVANSLAALEAGADRIQGTALGIGERAGNTPLEPAIINLVLAGHKYNLSKLENYSKVASEMFAIPIREGYPGIGKYVHSTAAGMHAAAIVKARMMKNEDLVGLVYGPFHPSIFSREVEIFIGPMSGKANVDWNLQRLGLRADDNQIQKILDTAKQLNRFLTDDEVKHLL